MAAKTQALIKKEPEIKEKPKKQKSLHRSNTNKVIAGVSGGIGEYFAIDPTLVRLLFVLLTIFGGSGILIYLIMWLIMPSSSSKLENNENVIKQNIDDISEKAKTFAHDLNIRTDGPNDSKFWWGFIIIVIGIVLLFQNFGIFDIINFEKFWPLLIILLGIFLLFKKK